MDKAYFDLIRKAQAEGDPVATYQKAIRGRLCVSAIDPFSGNPTNIILAGDPRDASTDKENITMVLWTDFEHDYFRRTNKLLLQHGYLVPAKPPEDKTVSVNEISDEELTAILEQPFFSLKSFLDKVTSDVPVARALNIAKDMNKAVGTINVITERLSELQRSDIS